MTGLVAAMAAAAKPNVYKGATIFSDRFDTPMTFAENWESKPGTVSKDGVIQCNGRTFSWRGKVPDEFVVEADVRVKPDYEPNPKNSQWIGFWVDNQRFQVQPKGFAFVIANGAVSYAPITGYKPGDWLHLTLVKKRTGSVVKFFFSVNDQEICQFADTKPERHDPIAFMGCTPYEVDNFTLSRVRHDADSNNLAFNGGFEHDEEGVPIYYNWLGDFDWSRPVAEYETDFLGRYAADRTVKHSGRQSLRLTLVPCCGRYSFWPWQVGGVEGQPGVLSVWAKTDVPEGVEVELHYGEGRRKVRVQGDWARYEVASTNLPKKSTYSRGSFAIVNKDRIRGHVWFDDLQAENVPLPKEGKFDYAKGSYATPFRPSELDRGRFDRPLPPKPAPGKADFRHPAAYRPGVLGRLDFYMDEPEAAWRVVDEQGRATIVTKPMSEIPMGTNAVTFAANGRTYTDTVVRLPCRKGATQVNRWTRSLRHNGTNELFTGLCIRPVGSPFDYEGKDFPGMFELLARKGFRHYQSLSHLYHEKKYPVAGLGKTVACFDEGLKRGFLHLNWWGTDAIESGPGGRPKDANALDMGECVAFHEKYDNILSHLILDEPELSRPSEWAEERLVWAKTFFPYVPVQMNNSCLGVPRRYANLKTDVLMLDDYLTNGEGRDVAGVVDNIDVLLKADDAKPCGFFLVCDNMTLHYRSPTYAEQVAQSWGVICSGGTIVSWYIGFPNLAGSWRGMVDVNREAQLFAPVILSEELAGQSACSADWRNGVRHLTRRHKGAWYVFSVNLYAGAMKQVAFTLPADAPQNGTVQVAGEHRSLELKNGRFTDDFAGHTRHIYRIK